VLSCGSFGVVATGGDGCGITIYAADAVLYPPGLVGVVDCLVSSVVEGGVDILSPVHNH
jgi:hypothetical protein